MYDGPAGLLYNVSPRELIAATLACRDTADKVQEQLWLLQKYVRDLHAHSWQGTASDNFEALMTDYDGYADQLYQALHWIAEGLHKSHSTYEEAEETAKSNVHRIQLPPPARLD